MFLYSSNCTLYLYQFHNLTVRIGDKILFDSVNPEITCFDSGGDGIIDKEIKAKALSEHESTNNQNPMVVENSSESPAE